MQEQGPGWYTFWSGCGGVAQLVERGIHKPKVSGSSPDAAIMLQELWLREEPVYRLQGGIE